MLMEEVTSSSEEPKSKSKREVWVSHIQAWEQSGLSQAAYCRKNDLATVIRKMQRAGIKFRPTA